MEKGVFLIQSTGIAQIPQDKWLQGLELGSTDAIVTLLVAALPGLTSLSLGGVFTLPKPTTLSSLKLFRIREQRSGPLLEPLSNLSKLEWQRYYQPDLDLHVSHEFIDLDVMAAAVNRIYHTVNDLSIGYVNNGLG